MARPKKPWFRVYADMVYDQKVRDLTIAGRWVWVAVMCLARTSPDPGKLIKATGKPVAIDDIADAAKAPEKDVKAALADMIAAEMIHMEDGIYVLTHWKERQFESDDITARANASRDRKKSEGSSGPGDEKPARNGQSNVTDPRDCNVAKHDDSNVARVGVSNGLRDDLATVSPSRVQNPRVTEIQNPRKTEVIVGGSDSGPDLSAPILTTAPASSPVSRPVVSPDDFPPTLEEDRQRRARQKTATQQGAIGTMNAAALNPPQHSGFGNLGGSTQRLGARWMQARDARQSGGRNVGN